MPKSIDRGAVQRLVSEGAQLIDVLPAEEYAQQHLPGAVNIPLKELRAETVAGLDRATPTVVYCWDYL